MVIPEAFREGRAAICRNIGGTAEKVKHSIIGLPFLVGRSANLAHSIEAAASTSRLWRRPRSPISPPPGMQDYPANQPVLYRSVRSLQAKAAAMRVASVGC
jgi:hypothetical protein